MKKLLRLSIFVVILAGLAMGTTFAFASGAKTILSLAQSGGKAVEAALAASKASLKGSNDSSTDVVAVNVSKRSDLRGNGAQENASSNFSATSSSDETQITGVVESLTSDAIVVSGSVIAITSETEFEDEIAVGDMVEIDVTGAPDGTLTADEIELFEDDDMEDPGDDDSDEDDFDDDSDDEDSDDDESDDEHDDDDSDDDDHEGDDD
jgi:hypothetical protein